MKVSIINTKGIKTLGIFCILLIAYCIMLSRPISISVTDLGMKCFVRHKWCPGHPSCQKPKANTSYIAVLGSMYNG
ncbi:hypothetical protein P9120_17975 [Bacillus subtilis]|uniref:hypothetical protein n=1 Tax=Bacillus subtilis TaxID=1423 RepID=UPI002DB6DBA1|nr:hypothetical protein [Bacillus subtilis]MEC3652910.1 hypothetical protein [Bacillus subtilis]